MPYRQNFLKHYLLAIIAFAALFGTAIARAEVATGWVGDLPVPAEALIETSGAVNFDSPSGRVIQFTFQIALDEAEIKAFYKDRLAHLGWQKHNNSYYRGTEQMRIVKSSQHAIDGRDSYHVTLAPRDSETFQ